MDNFNIKSILVILFLFFIGCIMGWCIEVIFRKFFSKSNPSHKWINPGFLIGPYLPLYGSGLVVLYLLSLIHIDAVDAHPVLQKVLVVLIMAIAMTVVEYIAGRIFIIGMNIKLWDYSDEWGNIQGIICPLFSFFWGVIAALYYFFLHPHILNAVYWLADHLTFSFFIGFFYGVFVIDCVVSFNLMNKVKKFAKENDLIVRVEELKSRLALDREKFKEKPDICNAIGAHHDEVEQQSLLAPIVQVCDAISGARPGARREVVEAYIKRLNDLEQLALSYPGVIKTYAIQAGRELRVIVGADKLDDAETEKLSAVLAQRIQDELTYPGQVKITVIRETRSVSFAK